MAVQLNDITVDFPGTRALDSVSAEFRFDEIHGLIGENGAGKSTLVNVLGGCLTPTSGNLMLNNKLLKLSSPRKALSEGIAYVSQEGSLVDALTGAENILLGNEPLGNFGIVRRTTLLKRAQSLLAHWFPDVEIDLDKVVGEMAVAEQKVIEIVRALRGEVKLLILDEPTATLQNNEKSQLWEIIRDLPKRGVGVVLISHFLSEIMELSDRITVLRDGHHVATLDKADTNEGHLIELMLRRKQDAKQISKKKRGADTLGEPVLSVNNWQSGNVTVNNFALKAGEIVGLIGLTGAGHFGFARSFYTRYAVSDGELKIMGKTVNSPNVRTMQRLGVAFIPDHRMENALMADGSLVDNLSLVHLEHSTIGRTGILNRRSEKSEAVKIMELLKIKAAGHHQLVRNLSGGNKQKVSLGKWLFGVDKRHYRAMIFIEPTEGVDIGAKQDIYKHMRELADSGVGILIASSDLLEIEHIADRVIPFVSGHPGQEISYKDFSESRFIAAMARE